MEGKMINSANQLSQRVTGALPEVPASSKFPLTTASDTLEGVSSAYGALGG